MIFCVSCPDCSLNEDNFSLRCPKHKVKKERLVFLLFSGSLFVIQWSFSHSDHNWFLSVSVPVIFSLCLSSRSPLCLFSSLSLPRASGQLSQFTWSSQREAEWSTEEEEMQESGSCECRLGELFYFCLVFQDAFGLFRKQQQRYLKPTLVPSFEHIIQY